MNAGYAVLGIAALVGAYFLFGAPMAQAAMDSSTGSNSAGTGVVPLQITFNQLTPEEIAAVATAAGFVGQDLMTAVAIALAESGGNASAIGDQKLAPSNGPSYGLWQINTGTRAHPEYSQVQLFDPQFNANVAFLLYTRASQQFTDWSTYNDGTWASYIDTATVATGGDTSGYISV